MLKKELNVDISLNEIASAFRMKKGSKDNTRPVMVKFSSLRSKEVVMRAKKQLRVNKRPVFISEHLTKHNADLYNKARSLVKEKKLFSTWSFNGQIFYKISSDASSRPVLLKSFEALPR